MTRFFYDTEFHEDGRTIDLISFGMVSEYGDEFYAINAHADWERISKHDWLAKNVLPHLPGRWHDMTERGETIRVWQPYFNDLRVMPKVTLRDRLRRFIEQHGSDRDLHQLWAWYGAYDHVALAQLFGRMVDLPGCIPMHTNDLKTLVGKREVPVPHGATEHDALADARWNHDVWEWWASERRIELDQHRGLYRAQGAAPFTDAWNRMTPQDRRNVRHALGQAPLAGLLDRATGLEGE